MQADDKVEYRVFKQHMYGGPKGLGDPNYRHEHSQVNSYTLYDFLLFFRDMSKMEEDPMIPQVQKCYIFCSFVILFIHFHFPPENAGHYKNTVVYEGGGILHTFI